MFDLIFDLIVVVDVLNKINIFNISECVNKKNNNSTRKCIISKKSYTNVNIDNIQLINNCLNKYSFFSVFNYNYNLIVLCITVVKQKINSKKNCNENVFDQSLCEN